MYDLPHVSMFTIETLSENKYRSKLKQMRDMLEKMTRDWNADDRNRDQAVQILPQMRQSKEQMVDTMKQMLERDGLLEECLAKGDQI